MAIPNAFEDETNSWWIREGEKLAEDGRDLLYLIQGAEMERERIIKLIEGMDIHTTHSELCTRRHLFAQKLVERLKGENK